MLLVRLDADPSLLVFPVRGDALLGDRVHFLGSDLHFERDALGTDHRRVQRLIPVRAWHRDEILEPAGHWRPGLVDGAEGRVAVGDGCRDDAERDEVVDLFEGNPLTLDLLMDAVEPLHA